MPSQQPTSYLTQEGVHVRRLLRWHAHQLELRQRLPHDGYRCGRDCKHLAAPSRDCRSHSWKY
eukprot:7107203-Prymnesium_polylepis.1